MAGQRFTRKGQAQYYLMDMVEKQTLARVGREGVQELLSQLGDTGVDRLTADELGRLEEFLRAFAQACKH